ncbi:FAD-binding monooxygenase moxY [Cladobotryum mycophilum]|uniref:FAD-binding monooxygenase moxY n=1 Tax=Cladobotryum mycophilum TaxID=491253 RepID=A0ABR0SLA2_9HYPO
MSSSTNVHVTPPHNGTEEVSLINRFIDEPRPLRVAVIGGGLSGILAGILLPAKVPGLALTIYEKNDDFGGTWLENVYPGVRCDTTAHAYQATFSHNSDWSEAFPPGAEIREYWQSVARKYDVHQYTKFKHRVEAASWDANQGKWMLKILNTDTNDTLSEDFDFVITCIGKFNSWKLPDYPGIAEYKGLLRHTSNWDPSFDPRGKRVAVIGNGASGVQVVPSLQKTAGHLDHYARSATWAGSPSAHYDKFIEVRKDVEDRTWRGYRSVLRGSEENQNLRGRFIGFMRERLAKKPKLLDNFIPSFPPGCRRVTPAPGYLEAVAEDNVTYIRTPIKRFTATGIETQDGVHREVDAIFCATGFKTTVASQFSIMANGQNLYDVWKPDSEAGFPYTYIGLATPGFPNLLFIHGPQSYTPSGTLPYALENQLTYAAKLLRKASREGIKSMDPSSRAADDFAAYSDAFFKKTVLTDGCSSSHNGERPGGRIYGFWPGSAMHLAIIRREPRWEDWNYQYLSESGNRFLWYFGNGFSRKEEDPDADMTQYLQTGAKTDFRDIHESWWKIP